jgi:hypothetical protein
MPGESGYLVPPKLQRALQRVIRKQEQRETAAVARTMSSYWGYWYRRLVVLENTRRERTRHE